MKFGRNHFRTSHLFSLKKNRHSNIKEKMCVITTQLLDVKIPQPIQSAYFSMKKLNFVLLALHNIVFFLNNYLFFKTSSYFSVKKLKEHRRNMPGFLLLNQY